MNPLYADFQLSARAVADYREKGFVVLRQLFTPAFLEQLAAGMQAQLAAPSDPYQRGFDRLVYDTCVGNQGVYALLASPRFRNLLRQISARDLFFTQGAGFRLRQRVSTGLSWHIESQSFGYQQPDDDALTLWTPLHPVRRSAQRGGMRYVPRSVLCGRFMYAQVAPAMFRYVEQRLLQGDLPFEEYVALRDGALNGEPLRNLLEHHAEEDDFEPGDVLLMNKYVIHRSVVLGEGALPVRDAFAFRFIDATSRYNASGARNVEIPRRHYGYEGPTRFHLDVCERDGERIIDSPLFAADRAMRHVGARKASAPQPISASTLPARRARAQSAP